MINTIDILKQLIAIPSFVDGQQTEEQLAEFVVQFFKKNAPLYIIAKQHVAKGRFNIIASQSNAPTYAFVGHLDTVLPQQQTLSPFLPIEKDGYISGLGSVDMKSGLAIMLYLAATSTRKDLMFIFTVDEEYEFLGMKKLCTSNILNTYKKPKLIINLEPTNLQILNGCRGITEFSFVVRGKSAHAGRKNLGINAIEQAVTLTQSLEHSIQRFDVESKSTLNLAYLRGGLLKSQQNNSVELSNLGLVVPDYAEVNCEVRFANTKTNSNTITEWIQQEAMKRNVRIEKLKFKFVLNSFSTNKSELTDLEDAIRNNNIEVMYQDISNSGFYEVQLLQEVWDVPAVVFGPGPSEKSHTADEKVSVQSIQKVKQIISTLLELK